MDTAEPAERSVFLCPKTQPNERQIVVTIETQYSKKLGLPHYSSHQYSVTVRTEVGDLTQIEAESEKLYRLLQNSVDQVIQHSGFIGTETEGTKGHHRNGPGDIWRCSEKQKTLLLKLVADNNLDKQEVENLAAQWQRIPVKAMNKLQMSAFISDIIEHFGLNNRPRVSTRPAPGPRPR